MLSTAVDTVYEDHKQMGSRTHQDQAGLWASNADTAFYLVVRGRGGP